jgi:ADP-ribosyl-[dinitrogen reductase] hydrolase
VLVHCKGGLGRAGTVAALMLLELGMTPSDAIRMVRQARKGAIETPGQEQYVRGWVAAALSAVLPTNATTGMPA